MISFATLDFVLVLLGVFLLQRISLTAKGEKNPLPPGPKSLPVIGNLLDMPASYQWQTFTEWKKHWGK